jgi:hypothetical protein
LPGFEIVCIRPFYFSKHDLDKSKRNTEVGLIDFTLCLNHSDEN